VDGFALSLSDRSGFPVAIGHGVQDPVISVQFARDARRQLEAAGADVLYRESPMPHTIDPAFLDLLAGWVAEVVRGAAASERA
ncbi:MAG: alpha/beta hydrolase, partial [Solirubrobacteraceae bacterium]